LTTLQPRCYRHGRSGSPHWTISATGSSAKLHKPAYSRQIRQGFAIEHQRIRLSAPATGNDRPANQDHQFGEVLERDRHDTAFGGNSHPWNRRSTDVGAGLAIERDAWEFSRCRDIERR
jgi:hypothetical protein